ncbi:hypothetical protein [Actinomadura rubrisoli]|uniref:hypothetical protein n=1 Tax=Actinomadura rubrisoli TaxID=2530368 RepID=UPI0014054C39|nr:hypothetical protein [Actinomadura rubrisoli]
MCSVLRSSPHSFRAVARVFWRGAADYASHRYEVVPVPDDVRGGLYECLDRLV